MAEMIPPISSSERRKIEELSAMANAMPILFLSFYFFFFNTKTSPT